MIFDRVYKAMARDGITHTVTPRGPADWKAAVEHPCGLRGHGTGTTQREAVLNALVKLKRKLEKANGTEGNTGSAQAG